jgi:hypothetical protein
MKRRKPWNQKVRVGGVPRFSKPLVHQRRDRWFVPAARGAGFAAGDLAGSCRAAASADRPALTSRIPEP